MSSKGTEKIKKNSASKAVAIRRSEEHTSELQSQSRYSILLGVASTAGALIIGIFIGSISGYFGGQVDNIIMRILDVIQSMPSMLFAIIISAVLGAGFVQTIVALSVASIPGMARMMRANILSVRDMEYIEAAKSIKC